MNEPRAPKLNVMQELRKTLTGECADPAEHLRQRGYRLLMMEQTPEMPPATGVRTVLGREIEIG